MSASANCDYALIIGIDHYPHLKELEGPVKDAKRVADWLERRGGLPRENVKRIESSRARQGQPVLAEVDAALEEILTRAEAPAGAGRRLYIYFAGHGMSQELEHVALFMADAAEGHYNRAAANAVEYRKALARRVFREQIYLFDCCRRYDAITWGTKPNWDTNPKEKNLTGLVQVVMFAAGFQEAAWERRMHYDERRGLFTEALMEGLEGAAASQNRIVTSDRLASYVQRRVEDLARRWKVEEDQNCECTVYGRQRPLILATDVDPRVRSVTVTFPKGTKHLIVTDEGGETLTAIPVRPHDTDALLDLPLAWLKITAESTASTKASKVIDLMPDGNNTTYLVDLGGRAP
ncbi:caspase family protein [Streptomyces sp. NRRL S-378]|uniref:caspase family protein n=1 Tax=Streptomyces sp. NRRL S-378 TaxID=1463904 RepID=UPI0005631AF9|nr:caspase family protein [Streptomyces sp. NRRL S-378]